jgi:N-formylglutamate deformylase
MDKNRAVIDLLRSLVIPMQILITIPHANLFFPEKIRYQFAQQPSTLNRHLDFGVDRICKIRGYDILEARASRFVVDLNRDREDIHADQGVIIRKDWHGNKVLAKELTPGEIEERLKKYYDPFHQRFEQILLSQKNLFVFDCHAMDSIGNLAGGDPGKERPDICLATDSGRTCSEEIVNIFKEEFKKKCYRVAEDTPYKGARAKIIQRAKEAGAAAIALEMNKSIYMDEQTLQLNEKAVRKLRQRIKNILVKMSDL